MHSLSMGEVVAATPVLKKVREQYPDLEIALSVTTDSGYESALNAGIADHLFFHPLAQFMAMCLFKRIFQKIIKKIHQLQ